MMKVRGEPGKVKKQVDVSESSLNALMAELQAANLQIQAVDKTLKEQVVLVDPGPSRPLDFGPFLHLAESAGFLRCGDLASAQPVWHAAL